MRSACSITSVSFPFDTGREWVHQREQLGPLLDTPTSGFIRFWFIPENIYVRVVLRRITLALRQSQVKTTGIQGLSQLDDWIEGNKKNEGGERITLKNSPADFELASGPLFRLHISHML